MASTTNGQLIEDISVAIGRARESGTADTTIYQSLVGSAGNLFPGGGNPAPDTAKGLRDEAAFWRHRATRERIDAAAKIKSAVEWDAQARRCDAEATELETASR